MPGDSRSTPSSSPSSEDVAALSTSAPSEKAAGRRLRRLAHVDVAELRSVGPARARSLGALGITTVLDLLTHYPRRYEDWTSCVRVDELVEGAQASIVATVVRVGRRRARSGKGIVEAVLADASGRLSVTFFNQPWRYGQLQEGTDVVVSGKASRYRSSLQMANPRVEVVTGELDTLEVARIAAIYPLSERARLASTALGRFVDEALQRAGEFADPLPARHRGALGLVSRTEAFVAIHRPDSLEAKDRARRRLAFDELWRLQVKLVLRKRAIEADAKGIAHLVAPAPGDDDLVGAFLEGLPFPLTGAQCRVLDEIAADLASVVPMHRLLQGDVGAGKTVVALAAILYGVQGGHQGALMAPTEVLAEQHFLASLALLEGLSVPDEGRLDGRRPLRVELLTARTSATERARLRDDDGLVAADILVGTHALLSEDVRFSSLGVVVIDEQHRFGVDQRAALREKGSATPGEGSDPDLLVMTATPIPRTAAMTVYGDLDYSVLDELPAGRSPVATNLVTDPEGEGAIWQALREEVAKGHQGFVVCPLVRPRDAERDGDGEDGEEGEEGEELDPTVLDETDDERELSAQTRTSTETARRPAASAVEEVERLSNGPLKGLRLGLLHGQLPAKEKQAVMARMRDGSIDVLVATTVIEVGVDVANATVMVVRDADRFGLAQLHQLRGRVGRASDASSCFLLAPNAGDDALARLTALASTSDGFALAEIDLELRGEGTVLNSRQKGRSDLKLASLAHDRDLVEQARRVAEELVEEDPSLANHELLADELALLLDEGEESAYLFRS